MRAATQTSLLSTRNTDVTAGRLPPSAAGRLNRREAHSLSVKRDVFGVIDVILQAPVSVVQAGGDMVDGH